MINVLLYSSGLDSFIAYHLLPRNEDWLNAYLNLDSRYSRKESWALEEVRLPYAIWDFPIARYREQGDGFVPQRNLLMVSFAQALYDADQVAMAAVRGEYSRDKHPSFFKQASKLLSYTAGKPVRVFSPLASMTKTQAVTAYLKQGGDPDVLLQTVSCYDPVLAACGRCMSCYRRWVALENNELEQDWDYPPWEWIKENRKPLSSLKRLPMSQYLDFARAQVDAVKAHIRRSRRAARRHL